MAQKALGGFDVLMDLAGNFIEAQKGVWDHSEWLDFLSEVQKKGIELFDNTKDYLGLVLEAMKEVYKAYISTKGMENVMSDMSVHTVNYMKKTKGVWDQDGWEAYLKDFQKKGIDLTDETSSYLVSVLDAARELYIALSHMESKNGTK